MAFADKFWYQKPHLFNYLLFPFSFLFFLLTKLRKNAYQTGLLKVVHFDVPVIVVGNITVGGTGKTPTVIGLVKLLKDHGYRPGIISRGMGGKTKRQCTVVEESSDVSLVGDEAKLLLKRCECPMVVSIDRVAAARTLLAISDCNVIISDDGLQHYRLGRDIEIAVVDGARRFGNQFLLPSGPLRESVSRLNKVNFIICNGSAQSGEFSLRLEGRTIYSLIGKKEAALSTLAGKTIHAVAAIGNPNRFFKSLAASGISFQKHNFPDHYLFSKSDFVFNDDRLILMTEKDAVKCLTFADDRFWYLPVETKFDDGFCSLFLKQMAKYSL